MYRVKAAAGWMIGVAGVALAMAALWPREAITPAEKKARAEGRTVIVFWDRHQGHEHEMRRILIDEFNRSQDKVYVRPISIGYNACMEKLLTSIAGNSPPDLCALDSTMMVQLVAQGCFMPIEDRIAKAKGIRLDDILPYCREAVTFDGHVWGMPATTDTYCLLWNKNAFRKAGLDPERPPQTLKELEEYAAKLTIIGSSGIEQIGFLPWQPWDMTTMWGLFFGGQWYDPQTRRVCCAGDPRMIRMFYWQRSFAIEPGAKTHPPYAMDPEKILSFQSGFGSYMSANNPFYTGKIAMMAEGEWQVTFIPKYAPELDWGVAPLPMPEGEPPRGYGGSCVTDCIPRNCRHPEEAWQYIEWFYSPRPNGRTSPASDYCYAIHNIPANAVEARQERFMSNPKFRVFIENVTLRKVVASPVTPATQFLGDEMDRQRERVVFYRSTPEEALQAIQDNVNAELIAAERLMGRRAL